MHPSLIRFPSTQFYGGKIRSSESVEQIQPLRAPPWTGQHHAVWVHVTSGREQRAGTSFRNEEETTRIYQYIASLVNIGRVPRECHRSHSWQLRASQMPQGPVGPNLGSKTCLCPYGWWLPRARAGSDILFSGTNETSHGFSQR